jgi:hypothetical protein
MDSLRESKNLFTSDWESVVPFLKSLASFSKEWNPPTIMPIAANIIPRKTPSKGRKMTLIKSFSLPLTENAAM